MVGSWADNLVLCWAGKLAVASAALWVDLLVVRVETKADTMAACWVGPKAYCSVVWTVEWWVESKVSCLAVRMVGWMVENWANYLVEMTVASRALLMADQSATISAEQTVGCWGENWAGDSAPRSVEKWVDMSAVRWVVNWVDRLG